AYHPESGTSADKMAIPGRQRGTNTRPPVAPTKVRQRSVTAAFGSDFRRGVPYTVLGRCGVAAHCSSHGAHDGTASMAHRKSHYHGAIVARLQQAGACPHDFSVRTPPESSVARYAAQLQREQSGRAALDMVFLNLPKPHRVNTPLL